MKNIEKYEQEISQLVNEGESLECSIAYVSGISDQKTCFDQTCEECHKKCFEWMYSEYNVPILSDDEKDIVKAMIEFIRKFGCEVNYFCKHKCANGDCFIQTTFKNIVTGSIEIMDSPYFNNDMFKGMKIYKKYKLEELGITCPTQKDN